MRRTPAVNTESVKSNGREGEHRLTEGGKAGGKRDSKGTWLRRNVSSPSKDLNYPLGSRGLYLRSRGYMKLLLQLVYFHEGRNNPRWFVLVEHKGDTGCSWEGGKAGIKPQPQILVS